MKAFPLVLVALTACAAAAAHGSPSAARAQIVPLPCPAAGIDSATVRPLQDHPTPVSDARPPLPIPADVRQHRATIRLVVDTSGRVRPDSITICGLSNADYVRRLAQVVATIRFAPARNGAPVAGPTRLEWRF